jgi:hypothetical protein
MKLTKKKAVVVTTEFRGVFFGYLDKGADENAKDLVLLDARCAIYWSGARGFMGLASHGPESGSKIGSKAPRVLLHGITSVSDCTPDAEKAWTTWRS